jgi:hypothetical protein
MGGDAPDTKERTPTSRVLEELLDQAPANYFTLGWLVIALHERSFFIIILFLGLLAMAPVGSSMPGLMLVLVGVQMIAGHHRPMVPHFIAARPVPTEHLLRVGRRTILVLKYFEKAVHPRWPAICEATKRVIGIIILLLTLALLLIPVPLSNVAPAMVIALIALAYIEEDGLLLSVALLAAIVLIGAAFAAVWETILAALHVGQT